MEILAILAAVGLGLVGAAYGLGRSHEETSDAQDEAEAAKHEAKKLGKRRRRGRDLLRRLRNGKR